MTARVTEIFRHPIKSHGRESLASVALIAGQTMPYDRLWAVAHERSEADGSIWAACRNFTRVAGSPALAAISAELDEASETLTLRHPARTDLTFRPDEDCTRLLAWLEGFTPQNRPQPVRLLRGATRGFTDSERGHLTLCNRASHRAVEETIGHPLAIERWRGNLWIDGAPAWAENNWIGREIRLGGAVLKILARTQRCLATHANPETGERDAQVLTALDSFGHRDFSVKAEVVRDGTVALDDTVELL